MRMTNAQRIAANLDGLADLIYRADDINLEICQAEFGDRDDLIGCKFPDEDKGCQKCIREWLEKEDEDEL